MKPVRVGRMYTLICQRANARCHSERMPEANSEVTVCMTVCPHRKSMMMHLHKLDEYYRRVLV